MPTTAEAAAIAIVMGSARAWGESMGSAIADSGSTRPTGERIEAAKKLRRFNDIWHPSESIRKAIFLGQDLSRKYSGGDLALSRHAMGAVPMVSNRASAYF
jgi:hypothetical protein